MQNRKKQDSISVNIITPRDNIKAVSKKPTGNADKDPFCIHAHKRHAVGSKIVNDDGSETICSEDGSWKHS